jgi:hypothetical protein
MNQNPSLVKETDRYPSRILSMMISFAGLIISLLSIYGLVGPSVLVWSVLIISFTCTLVVRKNRLLLFIFFIILYSNYSICSANYLNPVTNLFTTYAGTSYFTVGLTIMLLFVSILLLLLPLKINKFGFGDTLLTRRDCNGVLVIFLVVILALICVYGFGRPESLGSDRGTPTQLYEYSIIFFLVGYWLAGEKKWANILLTIVLFVFVLQNLVFGGRITALQLLILFFFLRLSPHMTWKSILPVIIFVFFVLTVIGNLRTSIWSATPAEIFSSIVSTLQSGLVLDTAYSSWHTSMTFLAYGDMTSDSTHLELFIKWLQSIVLGGSAVEDSQLPTVTRLYFVHYSGGILPIYFYFYLSWIGVILISIWTSFLIRLVNKYYSEGASSSKGTPIWVLCSSYVVVTVPRWFLYSPSQITRGLLLCIIVVWLFTFLDKLMKNRNASYAGEPETDLNV